METVLQQTRLSDIVDTSLLQHHLYTGMVVRHKHPSLPLTIYNYSQKAMYEPAWGDGTIDFCRGLIVDHHEFVVARPFKKFHNLNTASIPETLLENLPKNVRPSITEKMDGWLGIYWKYDGHSEIATRGLFDSTGAEWATRWLRYHEAARGCPVYFPEGFTPLFEIISKGTRIVCKYDEEQLVLIGMVENSTGRELPYHILDLHARGNQLKVVHRYILEEAAQSNQDGREGYVLSYEVAGTSPVKVKVKFDEYVRIHRIVTGVSPKAIWEILAKGGDWFKVDDSLPEKFSEWANKWRDKLNQEYQEIYATATHIYLNRPLNRGRDQREYRRVCAEYFMRESKPLAGVLFEMLDGNDVHEIIWKMVKPRGDDKSFRTEGE